MDVASEAHDYSAPTLVTSCTALPPVGALRLRTGKAGPAAPTGKEKSPAIVMAEQPDNPLHAVTLETIVIALSTQYGWEELGQRIPVRCFQSDPSVASSLKFLRKTPWARNKVEGLYLFMLREIKRSSPTVHNFPPPRERTTGD